MEPGWHSSSCSPVNSICAYIFMLVTSFWLGETSKSTFSMSRILSIRVSVSFLYLYISLHRNVLITLGKAVNL